MATFTMTEAAPFDVVAYLASKGLQGKSSAGNEVAFPCFFDCAEPPASRKRKLYINAEGGWFYCFRCGAKGGPERLRRHFGDAASAPLSTSVLARVRAVLEAAADFAAERLAGNDELLLELLRDRGLSAQTIIDRRLGHAGGGWSLAGEERDLDILKAAGLVHTSGEREGEDFFYDHLTIPYIELGAVVQLRGKALGGRARGRYMMGPGQRARMFNVDSLHGAEEVILTEGEFDAMRLAEVLASSQDERLQRMAVVGLPGVQALPEDFEARLRDMRLVYTGFDPDDAGRAGAKRVQDLLGPRVRVLELPDEAPKCDWTEFLLPTPIDVDEQYWRAKHPHGGHTAEDVAAMLSDAAGRRLWAVSDAFHEWRSIKNAGAGLQTGWAGLDAVLKPGIMPGQLLVLLAKTGTGKTNWLVNLAYQLRHLPLLFVSMEMTKAEVYERMQRVYFFHHPDARHPDVVKALANVMICEENRLNERDLGALLDEYEIETGVRPRALLLDYLGYFARGMRGGSPYEKTTNAAMTLKAVAKAHRIAVFAPHQVRRVARPGKPVDMEDARDSGAVEETSDFLLSIYRPEEAAQGNPSGAPSGRVQMEILKSRHGGAGRVFSLQFDPLSLVLVDADAPEAKTAARHCHDYWRGIHWDDLRAQQTQPKQLEAV